MRRFFEKRVSLRVQSLCNGLLSRLGFSISFQVTHLLSLRKLILTGVVITDNDQKTIIKIDNILCTLSLWQSLSGRWLAGELVYTNFVADWNIVAKGLFTLSNVVITFGVNRKKSTLLIETNGITFSAQVKRNHAQIEVLAELCANWDNYILTLGNNLKFGYLKNFCSSSPVLFNAMLTYSRKSKQPTFFNASVIADDFTLTDRHNHQIALDVINKTFLLNTLYAKHGGDYFTANAYIPYEVIPMHFIHALICTEDPNFWSHQGIDIYGINLAMAANLNSMKFERGGSTITMQLVRNLFLDHDKNMLRKVEECVIALLLENYFNIDKKEILELYLNLIEFAPNVYGLHNASRFYFSKPCSELTLTESLALTYVIPRPKHFYEALLQKTEQLQKNLHRHIQKYANVMLRKWLISYNDYNIIHNIIEFSPRFGTLTLPEFTLIDIKTHAPSNEVDNVTHHNAIIILDNGHGNNTTGKCSPIWDDGSQLFEFEFNRDIVQRIAAKLQKENIRHAILVPELEDVGLEERCTRANKISNNNNHEAILISIHANGGGKTGWECFTAAGKTDADGYAKILCEQFRANFPEWIMRFNSFPFLCKKDNFFILTNVDCPAILSENFFMDNEKDCRFIMSEQGREQIASAHVTAIKSMLNQMSLIKRV